MKLIITAVVLAVAAVSVEAQTTPDTQFLQLALTPEVALHSPDTPISGLSLSIWGENPQRGLAFGFVNGSTGDSGGLALGLVNYAESYSGVQFGFVNLASKNFSGLAYGAVNVAQQAGGMQWGLVNYAGSMTGVQVGIVNIINDNPWFQEFPNKLAKGFVFVNWSF